MDTFSVKLNLKNDSVKSLLCHKSLNDSGKIKKYFIDDWGHRDFKKFIGPSRNYSTINISDKTFYLLQNSSCRYYGEMYFIGHLSQYVNFEAFCDHLLEVCGPDLSDTILSAPLCRLDLKVDLIANFNEVHRSAYLPRKRLSKFYSSNSDTIYFGTGKKYLCIYEKNPSIDLVRFESRQFGNKNIYINCLNDLYLLLELPSPFEAIVFYSSEIGLIKKDISTADRVRALEFTICVREYGMQKARKAFNKNRNFSRCIPHLFEQETDLKKKLNNEWTDQLSFFLGRNQCK